MHPQLQTILDELASASERLRRLVDAFPAERWPVRVDPERWSVSECVAHLNLTSEAFIPRIRRKLEEGRRSDSSAPARFRHDALGWVLYRGMGPPVRLRVKTPAKYIPQAGAAPNELVSEFERLQIEQVACVEAAEGLPLHRIWVPSPFSRRLRYSLYSALTVLPLHQHRHLWQAEQVAAAADR